MKRIKAIICAGGQGTRLWPISRKNTPKQLKPFLDDSTLLQKTHNRLHSFLPAENIFLCTHKDLLADMKNQVSIADDRCIAEPERRDTAPAIALSVLKIYLSDPSAIVTNVWADHYIQNTDSYRSAFEVAEDYLQSNPEAIFMVGVRPQYPETGYGYIKAGAKLQEISGRPIHRVDSFKEKPNREIAEQYVASGDYLWNPAMFFFRADYGLELFKRHSPEIYGILMKIKEFIGTEKEAQVIEAEFAKMPKISIDYAIIEKADQMAVMPADLGWTDVGHWKSIYDVLTEGKNGHAVKGAQYVEIDSSNNLIFSETDQMISTIGVHDSLVIVSKDAILICEKSKAQDVKKIVEQLASLNLHHLM